MRRGRSLAAAAVVMLAASSVTSICRVCHADDKKEAQVLFNQGLKLAESGDSKGALVAFRGAYEKSPNFRVLYNIGQLCSRLQDNVCTVRSYEQYLREGGSNVPAKRRDAIEAELPALKRTLGTIAIRVSADSSEISVDDVPIGRSPLPAPLPVAVGAHKIVVKLPDAKTVERSVHIAIGGQTLNVEIEPPKEPEPTPPPKQPEPEKPAPMKAEKRPFPIIPWAVTGGFAVLTIASGIVAAVTYSSFQDKKREFPVERAELDSSQSTARTFFIITGVLGAATIVSGGIATYFTVTNRPPPAKGNITVGFSGTGIVLSGAMP